jgi:uncharacterized protein (TIGR01732 family)
MFRNENMPPVMGANVPPQAVMGANMPPQAVMGASMPPQQPYCFEAPAYGYAAPVNRCDDFVLIVILFILLIIVGATLCLC